MSAGQRQQIAIARALLRNAPILLLDEPTSSLDMLTDRNVRAALDEAMAGRTTIIVSHPLSAIRDAHRIVVLRGGTIVESGTHESLVSDSMLYNQLYRKTSS